MVKEDFKRRLREKLQDIPFETRKQWSEKELHIWWLKAKSDDSYLTWEGCHGDLWQHVKGMCEGLIGNN